MAERKNRGEFAPLSAPPTRGPMGLLDSFRRLFTGSDSTPDQGRGGLITTEEQAAAARWLEAMKSGKLNELCRGPFDVVIERRTVQLFPPAEQPATRDRLAARLAPDGLLISHQHMGRWKPGEPRTHFAQAWAADRGFSIQGFRLANDTGRTARLVFTTG